MMTSLTRCQLVACLCVALGLGLPLAAEAGELEPVEAAATTLGARTPAAGDQVRSSATVELDVSVTARMGKQGDKVSTIESTRTTTRVVELGDDLSAVQVEYPSASYQRVANGKSGSLPVPVVGRTYKVSLGATPTVTAADGTLVAERERAMVAADAHLLVPVVVAPEAAGQALEPGALLAIPAASVAALLPLDGKVTVDRADAAYLGTTRHGDRQVAVFEIAVAAANETGNGTLHVDLAGHLGIDVETGWASHVELEGTYKSGGEADGALAFKSDGTMRYVGEFEPVVK